MRFAAGPELTNDQPEEVLDGRDSLRLVKLRLALTLIAVALLPIAVLAPVARAVLDDTRTGLAERLAAEADHAAAEIRRELDGVRTSLQGLTTSEAVVAALAAPAGTGAGTPAVSAMSALLQRTSAIVTSVAVVDAAGAVHAVAGTPSATLAGAPPAGDRTVTIVSDASGRPTVLQLRAGIPGAAGGPSQGALIATISLPRLLDWASPDAAAAGRTVQLLDAGGRSLVSVGPAEGIDLSEEVLELANPESSEGQASIGLPEMGGWRVVATQPLPVNEVPFPAMAALVALIGLLVFVIWWMGRQILHPAAALEAQRARLHDLYETARDAALRDSLTGLGNHRAFQEAVTRMVDQSRRYGTPFALVLLDIDEFKRINDTRGHATGDELLAEVGSLIRSTVRIADAGYRIGGDEFALLLPSTDAAGAETTARRLLTRGLEDRARGRYQGPISFSAGVTACPEFGTTRIELTAQADAALYRGKRAGRTVVSLFDPALDRGQVDEGMRAELSAGISAVIESGGLSPVYQPIVHLPTGRILGYEGLVRVAPDSGFAHTGALFDAAEVAGRTLDLDRAALDVVLRGAHRIPAPALISLNVAPRSFEAPEFNAAVFLAILRRHEVGPDRVLLELTERDAIRDPDRLRTAILQLQEAGVRVAADDVGAGNAGLRLLSQFRFDVVKIDLSLVQGGAHADQTLSVLTSLVQLARRWGALTIAEGVETPIQLKMIRQLDVDAGQGYLLGRPGAVLDADRLDLDALESGVATSAAVVSTPVHSAARAASTGAVPFVAPASAAANAPNAASIIAGGAPNPFARG